MADSTLNAFDAKGTTAERMAFTPSPPTPATGPDSGYVWFDTDLVALYCWDGAAWQPASAGAGTVTHTGSLTSGQLVLGNGTADVAVGNLSGDISTSGSAVTAIGANKVTNAQLRTSTALTVVGRSANSTGNVADIAASAASDAVLRESGSVLGFGTIATAGIANSAVTLAKIANASASSKLVGSGASGSGAAYSELTLGTNLSMSGTTLNATGGGGSITQGVYASLPGTCTVGDMYLFTNSVYNFAQCATTNVWTLFLDGKIAVPPGVLSGWTGVNTGANWSQADAAGAIDIQITTNASLNWRLLTKVQPSTPYVITTSSTIILGQANANTAGIYFYDGTQLMGIEALTGGFTTVAQLRVEKINSVTSDNATAASTTTSFGAGPMHLRLANSGATLTFSYSVNGVTWYSLFSEAVGTFITPTKYGFGGLSVAAGGATSMSMNSIVIT